MVLTKIQIKKIIETYFAEKPVKRVWLIGSYARGDADEDSDLDVLVDIEKDANVGLDYFGWHIDLEEKVKKKVDVLSYGWVNKRIWPYIQKDMQLIYEK
jgi:predicted nucleotidyltransferase